MNYLFELINELLLWYFHSLGVASHCCQKRCTMCPPTGNINKMHALKNEQAFFDVFTQNVIAQHAQLINQYMYIREVRKNVHCILYKVAFILWARWKKTCTGSFRKGTGSGAGRQHPHQNLIEFQTDSSSRRPFPIPWVEQLSSRIAVNSWSISPMVP